MIWEKWQQFWLRTTTWNVYYKQRWKQGWRKRTRIYEECICECWTKRFVSRENLLGWLSTNCWCVRRKKAHDMCISKTKHWLATDRFYHIYYTLVNRCKSKRCDAYKYYWARWIQCLRKSFYEFYNDMHESYIEHCKQYWESETTIDRIDVDWNYCKENCRWATNLEQANNKTTNKNISYKWAEYTSLADLCRKLWLKYSMIRQRYAKYKDISKCIR